MNKNLKRILQVILFVLIIGAFIFVGTRDFTKKVTVDNERFDKEYSNVSKDNVFVYANAQDVYTRFKNGNAVVFMGFPSNKWSGYYAEMLNTAAKESGIKEILYYDFKKDREEKNATYQSIVLKLSSYTYTNDNGTQNIYAPTIFIIKDGKVMYFDNETSIMKGNLSPDDYWNENRKAVQINNFKMMFQDYLNN